MTKMRMNTMIERSFSPRRYLYLLGGTVSQHVKNGTLTKEYRILVSFLFFHLFFHLFFIFLFFYFLAFALQVLAEWKRLYPSEPVKLIRVLIVIHHMYMHAHLIFALYSHVGS